jgi:tetratricopeptide (TPR) repeat protein
VRWLQKALGRTGRKAAEELCTKGYIAAREGRLDEAQRLYDAAVDADATLAVAAFDAGQTALERFNRDAASLTPEERRARLTTARQHLERAVAVDATHAPSWRALARVHERLFDWEEAVRAWERVEGSIDQRVTHEPGAHLQQSAADERAEARRARARLGGLASLSVAVRRARALLAADDVDPAEASAAIDAVLAARVVVEADPSSPASTTGTATLIGCLARKGHDPRARALLEEAVRLNPADLEAVRNLATWCLAHDDLPAALSASIAAYRLDPVDAGLVCNVGVCHLALAKAGDVVDTARLASAREYIVLAQQLAPKDPIVVRAVAALAAWPS